MLDAERTTGDEARDAAFLAVARRYWHPIGRSLDIDPGSVVPVTLLGERLALWRTAAGELGLVDDCCVHRGTRLSLGRVGADGCVTCPYHGWEYGRDGACTRIPQLPASPIPARATVPAYRVEDHGGLVWACLVAETDEARGRPRVPDFGEPGLRTYVGEPKDWDCQSPRQIENFFDIAHFSVLHVDVFGNAEVMEVDPYQVEPSDDGWQLRVAYTYPALDPMEKLGGGVATTVRPLAMEYCVDLPFAVSLASAQDEQRGVLFAANQPLSATSSRVYWVQSVDESLDVPDKALELYQELVMGADRPIVASQRPERLPLDLAAELHLPFDRLAVAYRRRLVELGFPG
jgi:vanillate O-demethylase monooxygenase subunit